VCNAQNHKPNCHCGFGGEGHLGKSGGNLGYPSNIPPLQFSALETFINPNARCPVCNKPIFYYQSEHGGRVFFDELGPPWPKHPCTDRFTDIPLPILNFDSNSQNEYQWKLLGWNPLLACTLDSADPFSWRLTAIVDTDHCTVFINKDASENFISSKTEILFAQMRVLQQRICRLSLYTDDHSLLELDACSSRFTSRESHLNLSATYDPFGIKNQIVKTRQLKNLINTFPSRKRRISIEHIKDRLSSIAVLKRNIFDTNLLDHVNMEETILRELQDSLCRSALSGFEENAFRIAESDDLTTISKWGLIRRFVYLHNAYRGKDIDPTYKKKGEIINILIRLKATRSVMNGLHR
jgi:hypothetical protein